MNERNEMFLNPLDRQFIRILTDFGFKRMFGSKEHAGLLMRFLNALFEGKMVIKSVEFRDKEVLPFHPNGKKILYDIYCTTDRGEHFILEMQQVESDNFTTRILFYGASAIIKQGVRGIEYDIAPVYCVVFTDFYLSGMSHTLLKDIVLTDRYTKEVYSELLRLIFITLPEVPAEWDDCDTEILRILYLIKNMENMTRDSKPYKSGLYEEFFDAASTQMLSDEEAVAYSDSYYKELENQSAVRLAERKAMERGMEKGIQKGIEKGIQEGMEKGWDNAMISIAQKMLMSGTPLDQISAMTGLSLERLREL